MSRSGGRVVMPNPRPRQVDDCRRRAIQMMDSPRGREAVEGGYYLAMFTWLFGELERGRAPAGVPAKLLEEWRAAGRYGLERRARVEGRKKMQDA